MNLIGMLVLGFVSKEAIQQISERQERRQAWLQAREYVDYVQKPLLVVGAPKRVTNNHSGGDVTIDINPNIDAVCDYQVADVRAIPYSNGYFGAVMNSHVLEHLSANDAVTALREMHRVSDKVFTVIPHKTSIFAWLYSEHKSWVTLTGDGYIIEDRTTGKSIELVV